VIEVALYPINKWVLMGNIWEIYGNYGDLWEIYDLCEINGND
jgi:hypothetical protein